VGAIPSPASGVLALVLFALGTALSMAVITTTFGAIVMREPFARRVEWMVPALSMLTLVYGVWYGVRAVLP
jgi:cytochrome c biogenesis protein CcdA